MLRSINKFLSSRVSRPEKSWVVENLCYYLYKELGSKVLKLLNSIFFRDLSPSQLSSLLKSWEILTAEFSEVIIN